MFLPFDIFLLKLSLPLLRRSLLNGAVLLCGGLFCFFQMVHAQEIDYIDATFSVEYNNQTTQGENRLKVQRNHHHYDVNFTLDHWLLAENQKATFEMDHCKVQPQSYKTITKRPLKNETTQTLAFDWDNKRVKYHSGDEQQSFDLDTILYDPLSFFFEARCELIAGKKQFTYSVIHNGKKKTHTYQVVGTEIVDTGQGEFKAFIVERRRKNKDRQTRLYVAPDLGYLLVKIEHQESRLLKVVATLKNMQYQLADHNVEPVK